jgi:hypothetical protein
MRRIAPLLALPGVAAALLSPQEAAAHPEPPVSVDAGPGSRPIDGATTGR